MFITWDSVYSRLPLAAQFTEKAYLVSVFGGFGPWLYGSTVSEPEMWQNILMARSLWDSKAAHLMAGDLKGETGRTWLYNPISGHVFKDLPR